MRKKVWTLRLKLTQSQLHNKNNNKKIDIMKDRFEFLKNKFKIYKMLKKNKYVQKNQKIFFYNNRKFYYYHSYYTKFIKINKKINKFKYNKLFFLYDSLKLRGDVQNSGKLLYLYYYTLYKQKFLLNKYLENLYANFYAQPNNYRFINSHQLALLDNNKNPIKYTLNRLFNQIKKDFNSKRILLYRSSLPFLNNLKKNIKIFKLKKKKKIRKKIIFRVILKKKKKNLFKYLITPNTVYKGNFIFNKYKIFNGLYNFQPNNISSIVNRNYMGKFYRHLLHYGIRKR